MKKIIVFLFFISLIVLSNKPNNNYIRNAIRYRIVASDNTVTSQELKWTINEEVIRLIDTFDSTSKESIDKSIKDNLRKLDSIVGNYTKDYKIIYGSNYFPRKEYKGVIYNEGYYDSLVIYLGNNKGNNWWCFMFPPLCNLEMNKEKLSNIEYDFYFKSIIKKYL